MSSPVTVALLAPTLGLIAALPAQVGVRMHGGAMSARIVADGMRRLGGHERVEVPAGPISVHFGSDRNGKPSSLSLVANVGDEVTIAIAAAEPPFGGREFWLHDDARGQMREQYVDTLAMGDAAAVHVRAVGGAQLDVSDYRVSITFGEVSGLVGVVARHRPGEGCYLLAVEPGSTTVRLVRFMGGQHIVLAEAESPFELAASFTLTLQVDGFRLQGLVDDVPVLRVFDGALRRGSFGAAWTGDPPKNAGFYESVAPARPSASIVQRRDRAVLHAATTVPPGNLFVAELALDRPGPALPLSPAGFEPWLLQPPAAPRLMRAEWRRSWCDGGFGEVPSDGRLQIDLAWKRLPALAGRVAVARVVLGDAEGRAVTGSTPAVPVGF